MLVAYRSVSPDSLPPADCVERLPAPQPSQGAGLELPPGRQRAKVPASPYGGSIQSTPTRIDSISSRTSSCPASPNLRLARTCLANSFRMSGHRNRYLSNLAAGCILNRISRARRRSSCCCSNLSRSSHLAASAASLVTGPHGPFLPARRRWRASGRAPNQPRPAGRVRAQPF